MVPQIPEGYWIKIEKIPFGDLKRGDDVVFYSDLLKRNVCHMLDEWKYGRWKTKGLNNNGQDFGLLSSDNYKGKVIEIAKLPH